MYRHFKTRLRASLTLLALFMACAAHPAESNFQPVPLEGQTFVHDPSTIVKEGTNFYLFNTGPGISAKISTDLVHWDAGDPAFPVTPRWTKGYTTNFSSSLWAPDIIRVNGKYLLYYAASSFGSQRSAIGLATGTTLNQDSTHYAWHDAGQVITSSTNTAYNALDPSVFLDDDGRLWLAFGSFWEGIFLTELTPQTGLRIATNSPIYNLAWNNAIEAACLTRHGPYYYLFVNWGRCCRGTNSTYEVRVGRADKITGPYLDQDGDDLLDGGGTPFIGSDEPFIGPGHIGIVNNPSAPTNSPTLFSFHYYDADEEGVSLLAIGRIDWSSGWPMAATAFTNKWALTWSDEFNSNGPPDPANWDYENGFVRNHELQWYQPDNAVCTNGLLVIEARREHKPNPYYATNSSNWKANRQWIEYTSASLTTRRLREFQYGRFEMRARIDTRLGSWPAFWTLGATPGIRWPACGEIDIMEYYTGTVLANIGYGLRGKIKWSSVKKPIVDLGGSDWSQQFHTWTMDWNETNIDLLLDGQLMNHLNVAKANDADEGNPFHSPVYFILNQAIGGDCGGDPSHTDFPIRYELDWVRVYQPVPVLAP